MNSFCFSKYFIENQNRTWVFLNVIKIRERYRCGSPEEAERPGKVSPPIVIISSLLRNSVIIRTGPPAIRPRAACFSGSFCFLRASVCVCANNVGRGWLCNELIFRRAFLLSIPKCFYKVLLGAALGANKLCVSAVAICCPPRCFLVRHREVPSSSSGRMAKRQIFRIFGA